MAIKVLKPGLSSTVQDGGREGYYHLGIPPSGTLDRFGLAAANLLTGNSPETAALECTLTGPELLFEQDTLFAVSGAPMKLLLNGQPVPFNTCLRAKAGQQLKIIGAPSGARSYLAIAGGIDVPLILGSRSTYSLGSLGGYQGRRLQAGDTLPVTALCGHGPVGQQLPEEFTPAFPKHVELRVVPGMYIHRLIPESVDNFFSDEWRVSSESDRTGYRFLDGRPLSFVERTPPFGAGSDPSNIVDACYPIGSIQIPAGRTPIILHRDAVSGGGYMTLGTVVSSDLDILGQLPPGAKVQFTQVTLQQALDIRHTFQQKLQRLITALSC
ncbi:MAG: biotin-dependent carboxyltransferase family protein [Enterobacteriaceae bacterium]|jgi:biotin-dependent carboxylase-like uncharacterized protein|nr:biotin-dependent carboxyltransferase family protein [Enterobacteriaceae bacterium]